MRLVKAESAPDQVKQARKTFFKTIATGERGRTQSELNFLKQKAVRFLRAGMSCRKVLGDAGGRLISESVQHIKFLPEFASAFLCD